MPTFLHMSQPTLRAMPTVRAEDGLWAMIPVHRQYAGNDASVQYANRLSLCRRIIEESTGTLQQEWARTCLRIATAHREHRLLVPGEASQRDSIAKRVAARRRAGTRIPGRVAHGGA